MKNRSQEEITCNKCNETKPLECFQFRTDSGTYRKQCRICRQKQNTKDKYRRYREDPEHFKKVRKKYWRGNEKMLEWNRKYQKQYIEKNKEAYYSKRQKRFAERYAYDTEFVIKTKLRSRLSVALKKKYKSGSAIADLGCSIEELKQHLEKQFYPNTETGEIMTWENYGKFGWHIDHIRPLANFDLTKRKEFIKACHYTNLQPLWAKDNIKKGSKNQY